MKKIKAIRIHSCVRGYGPTLKLSPINKATPTAIRLLVLHLKESDYEYTSNIPPNRLHPFCKMRALSDIHVALAAHQFEEHHVLEEASGVPHVVGAQDTSHPQVHGIVLLLLLENPLALDVVRWAG